MYRRHQRQFCFGDSLHLWIVLNQFVGFWPYRKTARSFVKSKYHLFATAKCFVIFAFLFNSFNALLQRNIERTNYFTGVLTGISSTQILSWVILSACHNDQLLRLFYSFDKFDWAFHKLSGSIPSKKFYEFGRVKLLLAILVTDSLCFFILMIYDTNSKILKSIIIAILRFGFLLSHFSFVILYFHIVESSKLRFVALKTIWHEFIVTKIHRPFLHSHLSAKVAEITSLYNQLLSIVDSINVCLGTRLALLYFSMFYNACMYFYLICNGKRVSTVIFLGYPLATIIHVTLTTQNMISSADFKTELIMLPTNKLPDKLLGQVYQFLQQIRVCPVCIGVAGFFHINGKLLNSILMALASYLVAIFQLAPILVKIGTTTKFTI